MKCYDCKYWGSHEGKGDGTGIPYDAGHVNYCRHHAIDGDQHPSYGAYGECTSMVIADGHKQPQNILTRGSFGCILFEQRKVSKSK